MFCRFSIKISPTKNKRYCNLNNLKQSRRVRLKYVQVLRFDPFVDKHLQMKRLLSVYALFLPIGSGRTTPADVIMFTAERNPHERIKTK